MRGSARSTWYPASAVRVHAVHARLSASARRKRSTERSRAAPTTALVCSSSACASRRCACSSACCAADWEVGSCGDEEAGVVGGSRALEGGRPSNRATASSSPASSESSADKAAALIGAFKVLVHERGRLGDLGPGPWSWWGG